MLNPTILKHVAKPAKIVGASLPATALSVTITVIVLAILVVLALFQETLNPALLLVFVAAFSIPQAVGAYKTYQDPYWVEVWIARLRCKKTKNFIKTQHNYYGH